VSLITIVATLVLTTVASIIKSTRDDAKTKIEA